MAYSPHRNGQNGSPKAMRTERPPPPLGPSGKQAGLVSLQPSPNNRSNSTKAGPGHRRSSSLRNSKDEAGVPGRVRVAVRLRPRNAEEQLADAELGDCAELQPELKRLKLRKNNCDSEIFQFDEVLNETASQKRVYEVVAKPVVESVLEGYNGTVMAYGQTGTGKTFTLGKIGEEEDAPECGIMVRAMKEILVNTSSEQDLVTMSYLQLYMETVQDLLSPEKDNLIIVEDPKTGDVSLPGATVIEVRDQNTFIELLQLGEANRIAANTKMNTESSRSHAILLVNVKKTVKVKEDDGPNENGANIQANKVQRIRKSKLLIVDLAGSERVNKSGSDGVLLEEAKFINLSLTALGKCINALAESSPHVPIRDSKLTRLLRDSFGGTARTSLIVTIGPSPQHRAETTSTIMFGQRAMKVQNMIKLKEEFDYKSLCRKLETELDKLIAESERRGKAITEAEEELERSIEEARNSVMNAEMKLASHLEEAVQGKKTLEKDLMAIAHELEQERALKEKTEKEIRDNSRILQDQEKQMQSDRTRRQQEIEKLKQRNKEEIAQLTGKIRLECSQRDSLEKKMHELTERIAKYKEKSEVGESMAVLELRKELEEQCQLRGQTETQLQNLKSQAMKNLNEKIQKENKIEILEQKLEEQIKQRDKLEEEIKSLEQQIQQLSQEVEEKNGLLERQGSGKSLTGSDSRMSLHKVSRFRDDAIWNSQRGTMAKHIIDQVPLQKILPLLESDDINVKLHAVKVIANMAAEETNQEKILESGGLSSLIALLRNSGNETINGVAAGAIANLAMNETTQEMVMKEGGVKLLAEVANGVVDPQALRMVAGAIANLCGNEKMQGRLRDDGGLKALLGMVKSTTHPDVLTQVARGIANFAKSESRGFSKGQKTGRSILVDDGALPWIIANVRNDLLPIRRHTELALCHVAQHEANAEDLVMGGAVLELSRISRECAREEIRNLARRSLNGSQSFQMELRRMHMLH